MLRVVGLLLLGLVLAAMAGWGVLALWFFDLRSEALRQALAIAFGGLSLLLLAGFAQPRQRWRAVAAFLVLWLALLGWWSTIAPSNDRAWRADVARLPYAIIDGDRVTLHEVRRFSYRTEDDFTPAYETRTLDLRQLESVDLVAVYWMGPHIAHVFLSFGFTGQDPVAISIEVRKEANEGYSSVRGFFRQYELYYVVADERDVIRLRTHVRQNPPEDVYLYRLQGSRENLRRVFMDYLGRINSLRERPEFYNTLTTNCTTTIWAHTLVNEGHLPFSWKILVSGHLPELLYDAGRLDRSLPFEELRRRAYVNPRAKASDDDADFPRRIRALAANAAR